MPVNLALERWRQTVRSQDHAWLHSELNLKVSLGYMRPFLKLPPPKIKIKNGFLNKNYNY